MLILIGLDGTSEPLLDELCGSGRMPRLAALRREGTRVALTRPASLFPAGAFTTLWSGIPIGDHGLHYPFMWHAATHESDPSSISISRPGSGSGSRERGGPDAVVDPYEAPPPATVDGLYVSGWQFANRVVLRSWERPSGALADWKRRLGPGPRAEEVFGEPDERRLLELARVLIPASARAADLVAGVIGSVRPDVLVVSFPSVHVAGHQLWDPAVVLQDARPDVMRQLEQALPSVYVEDRRRSRPNPGRRTPTTPTSSYSRSSGCPPTRAAPTCSARCSARCWTDAGSREKDRVVRGGSAPTFPPRGARALPTCSPPGRHCAGRTSRAPES